MDRKCVHNSINDIYIVDIILIRKDFDTNSKTKKLKLDTSYSTTKKVIEILSNNRIKIENNGIEEIVSNNLVKKINYID